jgi:predicted anti-sigma-YlaC factor YlaD
MNNCFRVKGLLSAYLDRELSGEEMLLLRDHLGTCTECSLEFDELRRIKSALIQMPEIEVSPDLLARMQTQVFATAEPVPVSKGKFMATFGMAAAVLFLVFAVMRWVDVQRQTDIVDSGSPYSTKETVAAGNDQGQTFIPVTLASTPE